MPVYLIVILLIAVTYSSKLEDAKDRKYFRWGLYAKLFGGIAFALIYVYNYGGGDTLNYWHSANCLINLSIEDPNAFWHLMFGNMEPKYMSAFTPDTGYPYYRHDPHAFAVNRILVPFVFLGAKRFLLSTLVLSGTLYFVIFRFYRFLDNLYPKQKGIIAIAVLFVPSTIFWGSGLLKDSLTFSFALIMVVSIYNLIIKPNKWFKYLIYFGISAFIILSIKPYIFYALFAAALIWILANYTKRIESFALKVIFMPMLSIAIIGAGIFAFIRIGNTVGGAYGDIDSMVEKAWVTQNDLKQEYYEGNSFDIGEFDPTLAGMLSKFPKAIIAGLYRPFIWESKSALMLISGIENLLFLLLTVYIILRTGPIKVIRQILHEPFLIFCLVFAIIMAFFIGLTTANFGSLVRYRIPLIPFFLFGLLLIFKKRKKHTLET